MGRSITFCILIGLVVCCPAAAETEPTAGSLWTRDTAGARIDLRLRQTQVSVEISGFVARTTVSQSFHNPFDYPIEALYTFPLGDRSAVDRFEMQIGDRIVRGEVHPKAQAREIYETAKSEGRQAALLEQERPNVFSQQVANILPAEEIVVRLRTVETLDYERGRYSYRFPLVVGPRYVPPGRLRRSGDDERMDTARLPSGDHAPATRSGRDITIDVVVDAGVTLRGLTSDSHPIETARDGDARARVMLARQEVIENRDFVLRWEVGSDDPAAAVLAHRGSADGAFALLLQPRADVGKDQAAPKQVLFVLDTSGSMEGTPLRYSKQFVVRALETLGPNDTFNIIQFAGGSKTLFKHPMENTRGAVDQAIQWVNKAESGGGTEMLKGLVRAASEASDPDRYRMIIFLTDGYIGNEQEIFTAIDMLPEDVRVFALGIGGSVNHFLMHGMARHGHGATTIVEDEARIAEAVEEFRDWVTRPYLTDLSIDWGGLPIHDVYPQVVPDLFAGQNLNLVGRYYGGGSGKVTLTGRLAGQWWEKSFEVTLPGRNESHGSLLSVWARRGIDRLLDGYPSGVPDDVKEQVVELAVAYQLMSPYTSFVAVDYRRAVDPAETVRVEVCLPEAEPPAAAPSDIVETVRVMATAAVVRFEDTYKSTTFSQEYIQDLPVPGRFYQNVLTLAPGVTDSDGDGNPNVHGSRDRDFRVVVGGVSNVDPLTGQSMAQVNPNSIEEMEVISAGGGAEFSRAQGGFAKIVQKQGSNEFEGEADFTWRPDGLDGRSGDFSSLRAAMSSSGPIVQDRLWYRLSASWLDGSDAVDRLGPVDARTDDDASIGGRLTWQVSSRNKLGFEFDRQRQMDGSIDLSAMTGPSSASDLDWTQRRSKISWVAPYSPRLLVEAVVDLTDAESSAGPARVGTNACVTGPLAGAACLDLAVGELSGPVHRRVADDTRRLGLTSRFEYFSGRHWGAAHTIRGGLEWSADRYRRVLDREASLTRTVGAAWTARIAPTEVSDGTADARRWGLWAEDGIEFRRDLVLTVGVRVEETRLAYVGASSVDPSDELRRFLDGLAANPMAPPLDVAAAVFTGYEEVDAFLGGIDARLADPVDCGALCWQRAYDVATRTMRDRTIESISWSPNAQLAWDPFRTNKTKLFIGFDRRHGDVHDSLALAGRDPATSDLLVELGAPGVSAAPGAVASVNVQAVSASIATPYVDEWVMGFKREVAVESSIAVERIRRNGRRQLRSTDLNHRTGDFGRCVGGAVVPIFGGDGEPDDCTGPQGVPDGILDSYVQNPLWGDLIEIDSNGRSTYDAWQLTFERRQYLGWWFKAAYTYARHEGDGDPFNPWLGDERGLVESRWGPQSDDVRHQVKASGSWVSPWGFRFGGTLRYASGTPYTNYSYTLTPDVLPPGMDGVGVAQLRPRLIYVEGRNSLRADDVLNLDLRVTREMNLGRGVNLQWYVEVFNTFDQRALIVQNVLYDQGRSIDGLLDGRRRNGRSMTTGLRLAF